HSALRAALESATRLAMPGPDGSGNLRLRLGLHFGEALFGNFGSRDRWQVTLIGSDVNVAARLEQHKEEDERDAAALVSIRVSEEFAGLLTHGVLEGFSGVRQMIAKHNERIAYRLCPVRDVPQAEAMIRQIDTQLATTGGL